MPDFTEHFLFKIGIPKDHIPALMTYAKQLDADPNIAPLIRRFMKHEYRDIHSLLEEVDEIGARYGAHKYTAEWLFHVLAARPLLEKYRAVGVEEDIYWDSMRDLAWKYRECQEVYGIPGSFVAPWFDRFYCMSCFTLGRLQFEHSTWEAKCYTAAGMTLQEGDPVINIHIPSAGPLTQPLRMDAYRRAYRFYQGEFPDGILPMVCRSWLLYTPQRAFLPAGSNILSFMEDFDILSLSMQEPFSDAWRIFGDVSGKPMEDWPEDTSLRRRCKAWLLAGNKAGVGYGVILFDGERIVNQDGARHCKR